MLDNLHSVCYDGVELVVGKVVVPVYWISGCGDVPLNTGYSLVI